MRLLPRVETGCGCCQLETCCRVQGWLCMVGGALGMVWGVCALVTALKEAGTGSQELTVYLGVTGTVMLIVNFMFFVGSICLLRGLHLRKPQLMVAHIVLLGVNIFVSFGALIWGVCSPSERANFIIGTLFEAVMNYYMLACTFSAYEKMKEEQLPGPRGGESGYSNKM